jgi:fucose permease
MDLGQMDITAENKASKVTKLDIASWAAFMMVATTAIIVPVSLPEISKTFSTNYAEGGALESAKSVVILIMLLLSGILAQRWGKKRFLALGQFLYVVGFLMASVSQSYITLVLALMLLGVGGGLAEALLNPLIVDIHGQDSGRFLNISHAFFPVGVMTAALLFGELLTLGFPWRALFQIAAVGALVVAILFTVLRFPPAERDDSSYPRQFASILSLAGFWLFALAIFLGGSIESALTFWSRTYVESYLSDLPRAGALAVVVFAAAMATGRFLAGYLSHKVSYNTILISSAILGVGVSFMLPYATSLPTFYTLLALAGLATASFWPTILAEADAYLPVNTTILFVLLASAGILGFGFTPWVMGIIGDTAELRTGFIIIPALFAGLILLLAVERRLSKTASSR